MTPASAPADSRRFHVSWRIRDPLIVLACTYGLIVVLTVLMVVGFRQGLGSEARLDPSWAQRLLTDSPAIELWAMVQALLMLLFLSMLVFRRRQVSPASWFRSQRIRSDVREAIRLYFMALVLSAFVVFGISTVIHVAARYLGHADPEQAMRRYLDGLDRESSVLLGPQIGWLRVWVMAVLMPPVEELLFRGCLYPALRKRFNPWPANLMSSAVFAISHHYAFGLPNILVIGILCAYVYERTRSLWAPIAFHVLWNLSAASIAKPEVWWILIPMVLGLAVWSWSTGEAERGRQRIEGRRIGWKIYAVAYAALALLDAVSDPASLMFAWIDMPMWAGLLAYAWRRPIGGVRFWRAYAFVFMAWVLTGWWASTLPAGSLAAWQRLLAGPNSEPIVSWADLAVNCLGLTLVVSPALIVLSRLCTIGVGQRPRAGDASVR